LQLEASVRELTEADALYFFIVNETRRLLSYRQAILCTANLANPKQALRVQTISSLTVVDRNAPMLQWLENVIASLDHPKPISIPSRLTASCVSAELSKTWSDYALPYVVWVPFITVTATRLGGLWLSRETPWTANELAMLERLAKTYAHAWSALPKPASRSLFKLPVFRVTGALLLLSLIIPVRLSALAPVEIVPRQPFVLSAPVDGVIAEITIRPNQSVQTGQVLIKFEDTVLRNDFAIAEKSLAIAVAEHLHAMQGAFADQKNKADVALLQAKVDLAQAERDYAKDVLSKVAVKSLQNGVALFRDPMDWIGKPVKTGERIMEIADPDNMALRISLPVKEAIAINTGDKVRAFFDAAPLHPISATITQASYQAEVLSGDFLAYRIDADIETPSASPTLRIGWQGTAKVYGTQAPLFYYLFRRPIAAVRQFLGA